MRWNRFLLLLILAGLPSSLFANTLYFPQVVFGGGFSTILVVRNTGATFVASRVNFYSQNGASSPAFSTNITVLPGGWAKVALPNTGPLTIVWGMVDGGAGTLEGTAAFEWRNSDGALVATADIPGVAGRNSFTVPVDVTSSASTGIALANVRANSPVNVNLRLFAEDGSQVAGANDVRLSPLGSRSQIAAVVTDFFPQLNGTVFRGTLVVEAAAGALDNSLAVAALALREGTFSAIPVIPGGSAPTAGNTLYFPQIVFGGGYSTTFTIMNPGTTRVVSRLNFYEQGGTARAEFGTAIDLPAGGSTRFSLPGSGPVKVGWGEIGAARGL